MKTKKIRTKKVKTYADYHNRAVNIFKKSSKILIWAAILNVAGAIFGIFQNPTMYAMCLGSNNAIFRALEKLLPTMGVVGVDLLIVFISMVFAAFMIFIGIFSTKVKIVFIMIGAIFYLADFVMAFFFFYNETITTYLIALFCHVVIFAFIFLSVFEYYNVIYIEKKFKGYVVPKKSKDLKDTLKPVEEEDEHKYDFLEK